MKFERYGLVNQHEAKNLAVLPGYNRHARFLQLGYAGAGNSGHAVYEVDDVRAFLQQVDKKSGLLKPASRSTVMSLKRHAVETGALTEVATRTVHNKELICIRLPPELWRKTAKGQNFWCLVHQTWGP